LNGCAPVERGERWGDIEDPFAKGPQRGNGRSARWFYAALILLVGIGFAVTAPEIAPANTITVNTLADESISGDGLRSLREAINNANAASDITVGDCAAGKGRGTIVFSVSGAIILSSTLAAITNTLTIDGTGQSVTVDGATSYLVLPVSAGATLNLSDMTIAHGHGALIAS
jgi:hypothetical protein